jgi:prevent-host-death family protein
MKTVSAREANRGFSALLSQVEEGKEILITKHGRPVAVLCPYHASVMTPDRQRAIHHAIKLMAKGLPWGSAFRRFKRDEMHDR